MDQLEEKLNKLNSVETPENFHQSVMQKVYGWRFRTVSFVLFTILFVNLTVIVLHIDLKIIDAELIDMMQDLFVSFDITFEYFNTIFNSLFEVISPFIFFSALLSLAGVIYLGRRIYTSRFLI